MDEAVEEDEHERRLDGACFDGAIVLSFFFLSSTHLHSHHLIIIIHGSIR